MTSMGHDLTYIYIYIYIYIGDVYNEDTFVGLDQRQQTRKSGDAASRIEDSPTIYMYRYNLLHLGVSCAVN